MIKYLQLNIKSKCHYYKQIICLFSFESGFHFKLVHFKRLDKYTFPVEARQIEMGCNRKRGRQRKTKPALKYLEEVEYVFSDKDSKSEVPIEVAKTD